MTQNTVFQCVKNNFLLSQKKLIFFTILNLPMSLHATPAATLTSPGNTENTQTRQLSPEPYTCLQLYLRVSPTSKSLYSHVSLRPSVCSNVLSSKSLCPGRQLSAEPRTCVHSHVCPQPRVSSATCLCVLATQ